MWIEYVDGSGHHLQAIDAVTGSVIASFPASDFLAGGFTTPRGLNSDGSAYTNGAAGIYLCTTAGGTPDNFNPTHDDASSGCFGLGTGGTIWGISATDNSAARLTSVNYAAHTATEDLATGANRKIINFARNASAVTGRVYGFNDNGNFGIRYIDTSALTGTDIVSSSDGISVVVGADQNIYSTTLSGGNTTLRQHDKDGALLQTLALTGAYCASLYDSNGFLWMSGYLTGLDFKKVDPSTLTVIETVTNTNYTRILGEAFAGVPIMFGGGLPFGGWAILTPVTSIDITGVGASASPGTIAPSASKALTGNSGTGSPGTLIAVSAFAIAGLAATGAVGALTLSNTESLLGNMATGAPGTLGVQINTDVTVALTGVQAATSPGTLTPLGGTWPAPPFPVQILMDGPRNTTLKVAAAISVDFPQSLLADPMTLSPIEPGFPSGPMATRLALERVAFNITDGLQILLWWAAPVPTLLLTLEGHGELVFRKRGFLQNPDITQPGQILISSRGLSGTQTFTLTARLIKQGSIG